MECVQDWRSGKSPKGNRVAPHVKVDQVERVALLERFGDVTCLVILIFPGQPSFHRFDHVPFTNGLDPRARGRIARGKHSNFMALLHELFGKHVDDALYTSARTRGYSGPKGWNQSYSQPAGCVLQVHCAVDPISGDVKRPGRAAKPHSSIPISISAARTLASHNVFASIPRSPVYVVFGTSPSPGWQANSVIPGGSCDMISINASEVIPSG